MKSKAKEIVQRYKSYESTIVLKNKGGPLERLPVLTFLDAIHSAQSEIAPEEVVDEILVHKHETDISFRGETLRALLKWA